MDQDEINLFDLLDTVYLQRYLVLKITAIVSVLGLCYAIIATPIYKTDLLIQIEDQNAATPTALSNISALFGGKSVADAEMQILGSRLVISKAVDNLHLDFAAKPRYFPIIGAWVARRNHKLSRPGLLGMGGYAWGDESIEVGKFSVPEGLDGKTLTLVSGSGGSYRLIADGINKETSGKVGTLLTVNLAEGPLELLVNSIDANPGTRFILTHYSRLQTIENLQGRLEIVEKVKQSDILNVSLEGSDPRKIAEILNEIGAEYLFQNIEIKSAEADKTLHFLDQYTPKVKEKLDTLESKSVEAKAALGVIDESEEARAILRRLVSARQEALTLRTKREQLLSRFTSAYPAVKEVDAQLAAVRSDIANIESQIRNMPGREEKVLRQERDVQVDMETYSNLLKTAQQLRLIKEGSVGNVRIIDKAVVAEKPVRPKRLLIVALSMIAGLALGTLAAFVRRKMGGAIHDAHEIEDKASLKVMASIPYSIKQEQLYEQILNKAPGQFILEQHDAHDPSIEGLRSFRTALQFTMNEASNNRVLIAGATTGVGKSFVSVNLAAVLVAAGKRILLVDMDLRKGYLNQYFGMPRAHGLTEAVEGTLPLEQTLHRNILPNLDFIPTGELPKDPNAFLLKPELTHLMDRLSREYDIILIDSPPILAVTDATVLSRLVAINILVTREGVTTLGEIKESSKRFDQAGSALTGALYNGVIARPGYGYGYGYRYGRYRHSGYKYYQYRSVDQDDKS